MHIEINDNTTLQEIGKAFSDFYPFLKIEFFKTPHRKYELSGENEIAGPETAIGAIRKTHLTALLEIQPWHTVAEVEQAFQKRFGLSVQIFKKVNGNWVQTTGMDDLKLKDLNVLSRNAADEYILSETDPESADEG